MDIKIIGQIISVIAMTFNILSYQTKDSRSIISFQFFGTLFFSVSFFMLNAYVGAMLNVIGAVRALVYANRERWKINSAILIGVFSALFAVTYLLVFTVFGKPFNLFNAIVELLPVFSMVISTIAYGTKAKTFRILALVFSPMWLVYNIIVTSIGAIICETLCIISAIVALVRYAKEEKEDKQEASSTPQKEEDRENV